MNRRTDMVADLVARVDGDRLLDLLVRAVEEYSPSFAEEPAMQVFAEAIAEAGLPHIRQPVPGRTHGDQLGNLIVELGPQPPALLWVGHVDTVPLIEEEQLAAVREGDLLHGLGTADMKGACAAVVEALTVLAEAGITPPRGLAVALVVGEEEYGDGSEALAARITAPLTVIGEPTGLSPCVGHYGYYEYRLETRGAQVHAALPELGASAIHAMLGWLTALHEVAVEPPFAEAVAFNPREIRGGGDLFVVAPHCEAMVDFHVRPGFDDAQIPALVERARARSAERHALCGFAAEEEFASPGYDLSDGTGALTPLRIAFDGEGLAWAPTAFRSHSDAPMFHRTGSVPVVCGPGRLEVAHTRDEHVSIEELVRAARLYVRLIASACGLD